MDATDGERRGQGSAKAREDDGLGQQQPEEARFSSAQGPTDRQFTQAGARAAHHEIGRVQAGQDQDQGHGAKQ